MNFDLEIEAKGTLLPLVAFGQVLSKQQKTDEENYKPMCGLGASFCNLILNSGLFPIGITPFYIPMNVVERFLLLHILSNDCSFFLFDNNHLNGHGMASLVALFVIALMTNDTEHLIDQLFIFFEKMFIEAICLFLIGTLAFLLLRKSCYILLIFHLS